MTNDMNAAASGQWLLGGDLPVHRIGYGAMQLAGPGVFGPPADREQAKAVLRRAIELGINHIDTSDYYGPHVVNEIIKEALHPYPDGLAIVTKVGALRDAEGNWPSALTPAELRQAVHDNLLRLGVERMDLVNLRVGGFQEPVPGSVEEPFTALAELREQGLIRHLGVSNVNAEQLAEAQRIAPVAQVQNMFNVAQQLDAEMVDACPQRNVAYVPFFPLGGAFGDSRKPAQEERLAQLAEARGVSVRQVALAWLLARSPSILLIPGTSSVEHLAENVAVGEIKLSAAEIDGLRNNSE